MPRAPARADGWIPGTSPGMTNEMSSSNKPVAQSEGDTNLTGGRAAWQGRALDEATRAAAGGGRALFPAPVGVDAVPQRHRQGRGHLHRGRGGTAVHGFPRQQRASHRLRPSAPEAGDRRADGRAAVRTPPLRLRAGHRAGAQALQVSRRSARPRCCSRPAARTPSRWPSRLPARRRGGSRRCRSGMPSTAPASVPRRCRARRCSARARRRRSSPVRCTSRRSAAPAVPTERRARRPRARLCARMIEYVLEREGDIAALVAEPIARGALPAAGRILGARARRLRPARHAADLRRDPERARQDRGHVRLPARRRGARHAGARQGAGRRHPADRRRAGAAGARRGRPTGRSATTRTRRTR